MQNSWSSNVIEFTPSIIDESDRVIQGIASAPVYDRMNELITKEALEKALPGFMALPVLTVQHREFVAGLVKDAWFDDEGRLCIKAKLKKTREVDKVWELVKSGVLNSFSISGVRNNTSCVVNGSPCVTTDISLNAITLCGDNKINPQAQFDIVKAIFGDVSDMAEEEIKPDMQKAETTPDYKEFAKSFIAELQEAGVIAKACEEKEEEKKDDDKEDKFGKALEEMKKSFEELNSKFETLSGTVNDIVNNPMRKSVGFAIQDGKIVTVPVVENDMAKAEVETPKVEADVAYRNALMKMRLQ